MLPHLGAGVGQGFEDVYALCTLLKLPEIRKANLNVSEADLHFRRFFPHGDFLDCS